MTTTPTTWLLSQQVNPSSINLQFEQKVVGLSNGNFLVVFSDDSGTVGAGAGRDIVGVIYDAEGAIVTTAFQVNTFGSADTEMDPSIVADGNGGFYMAYEDQNVNGTQLLIQRYDAAGTSIDNAFVALDPGTQTVFQPSLAIAPTTGNLMVTYQYSDGNNDPIRGILMDSGLNAIAGTTATGFTVRSDADTAGSPGVFENDTVGLNNGNFVTVYRENDTDYGIEFVITNGTTGATISNQNVGVTGSNGVTDFAPKVAALDGGGFVLVWNEDEGTNDNIVFARYNASGTLQGAVTTVIDTGNDYRQPAVIGLEDGGFYIAAYDATDDRIEGTRYDAAGVRVGGNMAAVVPGITNFPEISLSLSSDGRILMTYDDPSGDIQTLILDPRETTINADAGDGQITARLTDNTTINGSSSSETLLGQDGNDTLLGNSGTDTLYGGDGNDLLDGGLFQDQSYGGAGNDTFRISLGHAADDVFGGSGTDTLDFSASSLSGDVTFTSGSSGTYLGAGYSFSSIEVIIGNNANRTWTMEFGTQSVVAGSGNDLFIHGDGMFLDNIDAGAGIDTFDASLENGTGIVADMAAGTIAGLGGTRTFTGFENVIGTQVDDVITGTSGDNTITGNGGDDSLIGGAGNDTFIVTNAAGSSAIVGGSGTDTIDLSGSTAAFSGSGIAIASGGASVSMSSIETMIGTDYGDVITSEGAFNDWLLGLGNDQLTLGLSAGIDNVDMGAGVDTVTNTLSGNFTIDLGAGTYTTGGSVSDLIGVENFNAASGNDIIVGSSGNNIIDGGAGNDTLTTGGGTDTLRGGDGNDDITSNGAGRYEGDAGDDYMRSGLGIETMDGGADEDTIDHTSFGGNYQFNMVTGLTNYGGEDFDNFENAIMGAGDDFVSGTAASNVIEGGLGNDTINSDAGVDSIYGGAGADELNGGAGRDFVYGNGGGDFLTGGGGNDKMFGGNNKDEMYGGKGKDQLRGESGIDKLYGNNDDDRLYGGDGNDILYGGSGDDRLYGGTGNDRLSGGSGSDDFIFTNNEGNNIIVGFDEFDNAEDINLVNVTAITSYADLVANYMTQVGANVIIDDSSGLTIKILDVDIADLGAADFLF